MPNWCYNTATIKHDDKEMIDGIQKVIDEHGEFFNYIRPNPAGEWQYDWSVENWGTKWDAEVNEPDRIDDNTIRVNFDSAWSPPISLYEYMVEELGYDVDAYYLEEGMCFAGHYFDGFDYYYDYSNMDASEVQDHLGEVDEFWGISERMRDDELNQKYDEWISDCDELERSDWFPIKIKPLNKGVYETKSDAWPYPNKSYWDGDQWCFYDFGLNAGLGKLMNKPTEWRGVTEESHLQGMLTEFEKDLDQLIEENNG